jgi:hypothetical protein
VGNVMWLEPNNKCRLTVTVMQYKILSQFHVCLDPGAGGLGTASPWCPVMMIACAVYMYLPSSRARSECGQARIDRHFGW